MRTKKKKKTEKMDRWKGGLGWELTIQNDSELHQHRLFYLSTTFLKRTIKKKRTDESLLYLSICRVIATMMSGNIYLPGVLLSARVGEYLY